MRNPICNCGADIEKTIHDLLCCQIYSVQRMQLLNDIHKLYPTLQNSSDDMPLTALLHGSEKSNLIANKKIIRLTIHFLKASERFV